MTRNMKTNKDAEAYDREYDGFLKQLEDFHQQRGTVFKRLPRINGKGVDLYLLYVVVTARGGWQKVNSRCEWEDILEDFRLPAGCVNSATALKHIYIRYLDAYERVNFLGEDGEERGAEMDEGEDSRLMRTKRAIRSLNTVPLSYNHQQHNVLESMRGSGGMSVDLYRPSLYDKLALSLISPLPNEHDFAFNVCTILSNEGRHVLQLTHCPVLVEHMLGHTGVYRDWDTQKFFLTNYKEAKGRSLIQFWIDSVYDRSVLDLLIPSSTDQKSICDGVGELRRYSLVDLSSGAIDNKNLLNLSSDSLEIFDDKEDGAEDTCENILGDGCIAGGTALNIGGRLNSGNFDTLCDSGIRRVPPLEMITQALRRDPILRRLEKVLECEGSDLKLAKDDGEIFHLGRDLGSQDPEGTRISQILHVIRNLSFEEHNVGILARSHTCLKFLVLCICSRWGGLAVNALDTLGNIAPDVTLQEPKVDSCSALLLANICHGVSSPDRAFVLRSLEILNKLAMNDPNEEILNHYIDSSVYDQICRYLTIHDIMLLIYTLECLYSLSSLGTPACNAIVRAKGSIHTLISLLTVEAQSYGPEACIGMKVVETVTGVVSEPEPVSQPPPPAPAPAATATTVGVAAVTPATPVVAISNPVTAVPVATVTPKASIIKAVSTVPVTPSVASEVPPDVEEFVKDWVTKNYEAAPGNAIEQAIVYRHFAASMQSLGRKQGLNPVLLSNCVRKVFGTGVGPSRRPVDAGSEKWHYNGIRRRDGIVMPPLPDKKRGGVRLNNTVPIYTPTPVLPPVNSISAQVTSEGRAVGTIIGAPQLVTTSAPPSDAVISPSSPILKAQLSAPLRPSPPPPARPPQGMVSGTMSQGVYSSTQQQQSPQQSQQQAQPANSRTDNSALIKSLLANKVTPAGVGQAGSMDPHPSHQSPHSRPLLAPSTPPQQPRGASGAVSYVQALSQGPLGPVGPMLSPTSIGCTSGMQVVSGGVAGGAGGQHGLHQPPPPPPSPAQVSRNIQKQQQQQQTTDTSQDSSGDSQVRKTSFNGICNEIKKCEDDSNSLLSGGLIDKKVTSFEGILQNGIKAEIDIKEEQVEPKAKKNVLADLLEKTVGGDILNGVVERELRISDRGIEFVNNGQQVKVNGPVTSNGQAGTETGQGVKRPATPDNTPAKRIAIEDPRAGTDSRITLYVSQNGNESGEVISQGHQVVLSQGQQLTATNASGAPQQMMVSQAVLAGQQQGAATQTVVTPQGQVILQRPATQTGMIVQQGGQIIQGATAGQVIQQVIQQGQSGQPQKVILHQGQVLGGQMILQNSSGQHQVLVQGGNNFQGQVIMQGVPHCQGQVFMQGNNTPGQLVMSNSQGQTVVVSGAHQAQQQVVVSSAQGQAMIVAGNQGQPMVVSGQQGQSGQVVVPSNVGGTVLLAPQQQGSTAKTLIILPNPKMIMSGGQHQGAQGQQLVLPRQVAGQQVVQVVSSSTAGPVPSVSTAVRTVHASTAVADTRATPTPPPVQIQSSSGGSSSVSVSTYSAQTSATLPTAIAPAPAGPTAVPVSQTSVSVGPQTPHVPAPQVLSSGVARRPGKPSGLQYLCEWRGCNQVFTSAAQVYHHACKIHCPPHIAEIQCGWAGCDPMVRRRFSAMTHLHDRHCNEQLLQIHAVRRNQLATTGKTEIPVPQTPPPHPGYAPNAAFHAIKRHALEVINQRDAVEKEGPVTKSIRLTAALILRNLVIYSNTGKKLLRGYESELANVALSTMESSRTVAQILYDIRLPDHQGL
ncbi:AT-rich interactive domain-containing protein 2-like isoform X2 [Eriocheir sinensis]|uniref:AT-rich interactive domain-containing protein 2-like isoform X2 n=1 Tax=Eriocheir sinensis TaxID=95602 RepID=UPI0021CA00E5|nr:AT-rich interactive domain-containing protein 2-like isoform X2 [Eriocheir sinensis]